MILSKSKPPLSHARVTLVPKRVAVVRPEILTELVTPSESVPIGNPFLSSTERLPSPPATINELEVSVPNSKELSTEPPVGPPKPDGSNRCLRVMPKSILFRVVIVIVVIVVCIVAGVVPPVVLLTGHKDSPSSSVTNLTASVCSSSTCIGSETSYRTSTITALFTFDGNYNDLSGIYSGVGYGSPIPTFTAGSNYIRLSIETYLANNQYLSIPDVNIRQRSFTLELWFLMSAGGLATDSGVFSQCGSDSICLGLSVRSGRVTLSFDSMNSSASVLIGSSLTTVSNWYHLAVVYDADRRQQLMYLNGRVDAISSGMANPYQGTAPGVVTLIGRSSSYNYPSSNFNGLLDHLTISAGVARTACQILNDATLIGYYPFDSTDTFLDRSVYLLNGLAAAITSIAAGRLQQAISFDGNASFFQAQSFPTIRASNTLFSVALWVNPSAVIGGGSIVHISTLQTGSGTVCYDLLGFTAAGTLVAQVMASATLLNSVQGTTLPVDTWTHLAVMYSTTNGLRLFINGQMIAAVASSIINNANNIFLTLGNNGPGFTLPTGTCLASTIAARAYRGMMDDLRVYNRELDSQELCVVMNN